MLTRFVLACAGVGAWLVVGCGAPSNSNWIGVNTGVGEPIVAPTTQPVVRSADYLARAIDCVDQLKTPLVRDYIMNWGAMQAQANGPIDFAVSDAFMRAAGKADADVLVVFDGIPAWASINSTAADIENGLPPRQYAQAFAAFVEKYVERYDGDARSDMTGLKHGVHTYQFMSAMEDLPTAEYAYWLKLFYQSVKRADSSAKVVLGGLSSPGVAAFDRPGNDYPRYFEYLLADQELEGPAYPYFDVAAFENFPSRYPGRSPFDDALAYLRQTMADHKLSLPIWLTAFGGSGEGKTLGDQADALVRWTLKARTIGIERVYWYTLNDAPAAKSPLLAQCGLVGQTDKGPVLKPAFQVLAKLVQEIRQRPYVTMRGNGWYVLTGTGEPLYVAWKEESYDPGRAIISGWWSVEPLNGPKVVRQGSEIQLTLSPLFLQKTSSPFIK